MLTDVKKTSRGYKNRVHRSMLTSDTVKFLFYFNLRHTFFILYGLCLGVA